MRRRTRSRLRWLAAGAVGALALACAPATPGPSGAPRAAGPGEPLMTSTAPADVVQPQPPAGFCHSHGSGLFTLPDPTFTPGAIDPAVSQKNIGSTICAEGFTARERPPEPVTEAEKQASMAAYGEADPLGRYEYDHLIPLELGGAVNDRRNLWPEPGASPNAKDRLEHVLNVLVCRRQLALRDAQRVIASNWIAAGNWVQAHDPRFRWRVS